MDLDTLREEIGRKDEEIVRLISERTELAKKVGENKVENGLSIRNTEVEGKVIERYRKLGERYGLSYSTMGIIASQLIREAVDAESRLVRTHSEKGEMVEISFTFLGLLGEDVAVVSMLPLDLSRSGKREALFGTGVGSYHPGFCVRLGFFFRSVSGMG